MATIAAGNDLIHQADTLDAAADALSPKISDAHISFEDRKKIFAQTQELRSQALQLRTMAATAVTRELSVEVANLQAAIDDAKKVLSTVNRVQDLIDVATSLAKLGMAITAGPPVAVPGALTSLQADVDRVKSA